MSVRRAAGLTVPLPIPAGRTLAVGEGLDWDWPEVATAAWTQAARRAGLTVEVVADPVAYPGLQAALVDVDGERLVLEVGPSHRGGHVVTASPRDLRRSMP